MQFFLGTHRPTWLERVDVPLFLSRRVLAGRRTYPRAVGPWVLDSGGFSELSMNGAWSITVADYADEVVRIAREVGRLEWVAPMDWMCEPVIVAKTGLSVKEHQRRTIENFQELRSILGPLVAPVIQGWTMTDYHRHVEDYDRAGIDLRAERVVGVGSVCRRQATVETEWILRTIAGHGIRVHGFGVKTVGLGRYAESLASSDSMAWCRSGGYEDGCSPGHKNESNCMRYAMAWRQKLLDRLDGPKQTWLGLGA